MTRRKLSEGGPKNSAGNLRPEQPCCVDYFSGETAGGSEGSMDSPGVLFSGCYMAVRFPFWMARWW